VQPKIERDAPASNARSIQGKLANQILPCGDANQSAEEQGRACSPTEANWNED
jgi:hypothetical protein